MIHPRKYQADAIESIDRFFLSGFGNPLVVAPTGAGKSVMIAMYCAQAVERYPGTKVMVLAHVKELIEQNAQAYGMVAQTACYGIYSASLGRSDWQDDVIFAQIQSVRKKAELFGFVDFCVIDECHLVNPKRMGCYREFLDGLMLVNPRLKVIGFSATPYRLGHGYITEGEGAIFTGTACDIPIGDLIADGMLVPPVARSGVVHADMANVRKSSGEYVASEAAAAFDVVTVAAVGDVLQRAIGRKSILVFACSIEHAKHVAEAFRTHGEASVEVVDGMTAKAARDDLVRRIRSGELRVLVNVGVFTTGFDAKNIDCVVLLRATMSAALYVQMVGRGLRPFPGKKDCLVLDYGENVMRHGPIDQVKPRKPGEKRATDMVMAKPCPACQALIALSCRTCPHCGEEIPVMESGPNHGTFAADADLLGATRDQWREVSEMRVSRHVPRGVGKTDSMRVDYRLGLAEWASEWICPDHGGRAKRSAGEWMQARGYGIIPVTQALAVMWPTPKRIKIVKEAGAAHWHVKDYEFGANWLVGA